MKKRSAKADEPQSDSEMMAVRSDFDDFEAETNDGLPNPFDDLDQYDSVERLAEEYDHEIADASATERIEDFDDGMFEDDLFDDEDF